MSDAYWGDIKAEKYEIIENLKQFCKDYNLEMPIINESWRLDIIQEISNKTKKAFWDRYKEERKKIVDKKVENKKATLYIYPKEFVKALNENCNIDFTNRKVIESKKFKDIISFSGYTTLINKNTGEEIQLKEYDNLSLSSLILNTEGDKLRYIQILAKEYSFYGTAIEKYYGEDDKERLNKIYKFVEGILNN